MAADHGSEERWETPVSDARSLALVSLVDQDGLRLTLQDVRDPERRRFRFSFERVPAYRNVLEEYRTSEPQRADRLGWTRIDPGSRWLADLRSREPLLDLLSPGCKHYIIVTEDDVLDVLAPEPPCIVELSPAPADEPVPGKSNVYYAPEDREQIDGLLDDIRQRGDDAVQS